MDEKFLEDAEALQQASVDAKLAQSQAQLDQTKQGRFFGWDGATCFDCGDDLTEARLAMKRVRCVHCQTVAEKKGNG